MQRYVYDSSKGTVIMLQGQVVCLLFIFLFILYCVHWVLNTTKSLSHSQFIPKINNVHHWVLYVIL